MSSFVSPAQTDITHISVRLFTDDRPEPQIVAFLDNATIHLDLDKAVELRDKLITALAEVPAVTP